MARTDERFRAAHNALLEQYACLSPGAGLPSELALARELGVSRTVVRAVLERLQTRGVISWEGRDKVLLRQPAAADRLQEPAAPATPEELEQQFLEWVLRFDVPPGTALNVTELSRKFSVPAYGVQEFLASLTRFGLVQRRPKGGWELVGFTRDFAVELSDFRLLLELNAVSTLVRQDAEHPIWAQLDTLRSDHLQLQAQLDSRYHDFSLLDERFHLAIGSVVRNRFAAEFQKVIKLIFHYHFQWDKTAERERNGTAIIEHLRLIDALESRDEEAALAAARDHLRTSKRTLLSSLRDNALV